MATTSNKSLTIPKSSSKSRSPSPSPKHKPTIEVTDASSVNSTREMKRLSNLLSKLDIRFKSCTFTYKESHLLKDSCGLKEKRKSKLAKFKTNLRNTLERFQEAVGCEESEFKNCIFVPKSDEENVQEFVKKNLNETQIRFENCKFVKRGSSLFEQVAKKLRGVFGIIFELTYPDSTAVVEEYTFRLKDLAIVTTYVQERIVEKG